jgi:A/G-specific adenine glycosylase
LPWRKTKDPYNIWVSEIILQQTRVSQGTGYYERFIEQFPDIETLAKAPLDKVMKAWQGLGYYSRARNMHRAAQTLHGELGGKFPERPREIKQLKGIGDYTAAAIASIAFNHPVAVLDGNVYRVLARYYGIQKALDSAPNKKFFLKLAEKHLPRENAGEFNQAIMDFGALQCTPGKPKCENCPLKGNCFAYNNNLVSILPLKKNKKESRNRYFNYFMVLENGSSFLQKRENNDIWHSLYEFPVIETPKQISKEKGMDLFIEKHGLNAGIKNAMKVSKIYRHILSHQTIHARFFIVHLNKASFLKNGYLPVSIQEIGSYAIPRLIDLFLKEYHEWISP